MGNENFDYATYNSLLAQKDEAQAQYNSCESRIEDYDYIIEKLKKAYQDIGTIKSEFINDVRNADSDIKDEKREWKGSNYDEFDEKMSSLDETEEGYANDSIDFIMDSLNDEITRLKNKQLEEYGILGDIGAWLNNLGNKLDNLFN